MGASTQRQQRSPINGIINEQNACLPMFGGSNNVTDTCCLSYKLQPHCIDNRHFHAWIKKYGRASCLHLADLTHKKTVKSWIQEDYELDFLPSKSVNSASLQMCNVVGFRKDLVVTQIFCQDAVKFIITGLNDNQCKLIFNKRYLQQQKLQLYHCYISPDENYMVIHQNTIYASMYAFEIENVEGIIIVKLNWATGIGEQISCDNLNNHVLPANHSYALTFDPRSDSDLSVFTYVAGSDRCNLSLYKIKKDLVLFQIALFKTAQMTLPGNFQNLQFLHDGSALFLSTLGNNASAHTGLAICRNKYVTVKWLDPVCYDILGSFNYISLTSVEHFSPMISASGRYCYCGGRLISLQNLMSKQCGMKPLRKLCMETLADLVLIEDLRKLPLPKMIINELETGKY